MQFIFTCQENNRDLTLYEFGLYDKTFKFNEWLDNEVGFAYTELTIKAMNDLIKHSPIIFVRHIFEVNELIKTDDCFHTILNICYKKLKIEESYNVQIRSSKKPCLEMKGLAVLFSNELTKHNYTLDIKNSKQTISIYIHTDNIYVGVDNVKNNLSKWKGGMPYYSQSANFNFISRAEYKLIEAVECMNINLREMKNGLDLGAAPGGWTKVLVDNNIKVVSIDPDKLNQKLQQNSNVKYYPILAEQYLQMNKDNKDNKFDIIVNDMKMDINKSVDITIKFYDKLVKNGIVIMTFKLPHKFSYKDILNGIKSLKGFELIGVRQFFHNRSEVTVILRKSENSGGI